MYKLALIEDEDFIRKSLVKIIKREIVDFEIVDIFADASLIINKLEEYDVILSDIKMPNMTGLELAEYVYENKCHPKIILLSAFSEFEYAKKAITYGVLNYLNKPVDINELKLALEKIKEVLDKENQIQINEKKDFYINLALGSISIQDIGMMVKKFEPKLDVIKDEIIIYEFQMENYKDFLKNIWKYDKGNLINSLCNFLEHNDDFIIRILINDNEKIFVMVCDKKTNKANSYIEEQIREIFSVLKLKLILDYKKHFNNIIAFLEDDNALSNDMVIAREQGKLLYSLIIEKKVDLAINIAGKIANVEKVFEIIIQKLNEDGYNTLHIKNDISYILWIKQVVSMLDAPQDANNIIMKIKEYINEYYMENISLEEISQSVYFNQAYLGRMFKEKTGESFNEYLQSVRLKKAQELLIDPNNKVYEISEKVGYKSTRYFYKIFNSYFGLTPMEYRKRRL